LSIVHLLVIVNKNSSYTIPARNKARPRHFNIYNSTGFPFVDPPNDNRNAASRL